MIYLKKITIKLNRYIKNKNIRKYKNLEKYFNQITF